MVIVFTKYRRTQLPGSNPRLRAFPVDRWTRLDRFLTLGAAGGTYSARAQVPTPEERRTVIECVEHDGPRAVGRIVDLGAGARTPRSEPAAFALAIAAKLGDDETRRAALDALPRVCPAGAQLFQFAREVESFGGWGRGTRRAVGRWYTEQPARELTEQALRCPGRDGWTHRDLLRLAHPRTEDAEKNAVLSWIMGAPRTAVGRATRLVQAVELARTATQVETVVALIREFALPKEAIPTHWLKTPEVWVALLDHLSFDELVTSLGAMTQVGLLSPTSESTRLLCERMAELSGLSRLDPMALLMARLSYLGACPGWVPAIAHALEDAFHASLGRATSTGRRWLVALDVSSSMGRGTLAGTPGLSPGLASAAMALGLAASERHATFVAFTGSQGVGGLSPIELRGGLRLDQVTRALSGLPFGPTDCALPMLHAERRGLDVDVFLVLTDSETWSGDLHPAHALQSYRIARGRAAKLIVVGLASQGFSIADPEDAGMLDVVGFDGQVPSLITGFARAELGQ